MIILYLSFSVSISFAQNEQNINAVDYLLQKRKASEKFEKGPFSDNMFVSLGGGFYHRIGPNSNNGYMSAFSLGKWFTPVKGLRLNFKSGDYQSPVYNYMFKVGIDYMMNISAFVSGYNEKRVFELVGLLGAGYTVIATNDKNYHSGGLEGGLQGKFRLTSYLDFYIEPRLNVYTDKYDTKSSWKKYDASGSVWAGFNYKIISSKKDNPASYYFRESSFLDNTFFSLSGGIQTFVSKSINPHVKCGPHASVFLGKWFDPYSGLRVGFSSGYSSYMPTPKSEAKLKVGGAHLDYLFRISAFQAYSPMRLFEVVLIGGVNATYVNRVGDKAITPGINLGVQGKFRLNDALDFFVEPKMSIYTSKFLGGYTSNTTDVLTSLDMGLSYKMAPYVKRKSMPRFENNNAAERIFVSVAGGANLLVSRAPTGLTNRQKIAPQLSLSIGKWFTSTSALRLQGEGSLISTIDSKKKYIRHKLVTVGLDYMWNITNAFSGYNPDRIVDFIGIAGVNLGKRSSDNGLLYGANGGFQVNFNVGKHWDVFVEPRLDIYPGRLGYGSLYNRIDGMASVNLGTSYVFKGYDKHKSRTLFNNETYNRLFFSLGGGPSVRISSVIVNDIQTKNYGYNGQIGVGYWYTPISAFRFTLRGEQLPDYANSNRKVTTYYGGLSVDYMMNITNLAHDFKQDRWFDFLAFAGVSGGLSVSQQTLFKKQVKGAQSKNNFAFVPGAHAGIQPNFNINPYFSIYLEPRINLYGKNYDDRASSNYVAVGSFTAGIKYKLNTKQRKRGRDNGEEPEKDNRMFVSLGVGTGLYDQTIIKGLPLRRKLTINSDAAFGKWFTSVSGIRLGINTTHVDIYGKADKSKFDLTIFDVQVDYLCNLSNLIAGDSQDRRFNMLGVAGVGVSIPGGVKQAKTVFSGQAGLQGNVRITHDWSVYLEPRMHIYNHNIDGSINVRKINGTATAVVGASYKF